MSRFTGFEEVYSALYVDFDNIYTRLRELDIDVARTFGTNPNRWVKWIENHALRILYGDGVRRRILKRICYLNPQCFQEFRPFFIRAAFQVVDCPPLTNQGKTSADIHLVMNCMDDLNHSTRFDEFIILSGDADFTPLLLRMQEHARRTLVLSVGYSSPAYTAAASWRVREDWFIQQALEDERPVETYAPPARVVSTRPGGENLRRAAEIVKRMVAEASQAVPIATVGQTLQRELEPGADWFGHGRLRDLLDALDIAPLEFSPIVPGFVFDPDRHEQPEERDSRDEFKAIYPELYEFALKVHRLTDMPLLRPEHYKALLGYIVEEVNQNGFFMTTTSRNVRDKCLEAGLPVARAHVNFVLVGIARGGYPLNEQQGVNMREVSKAFLRNAYDLCRMSQFSLEDQADQRMLLEWVMPKESLGE